MAHPSCSCVGISLLASGPCPPHGGRRPGRNGRAAARQALLRGGRLLTFTAFPPYTLSPRGSASSPAAGGHAAPPPVRVMTSKAQPRHPPGTGRHVRRVLLA